METPEHHLDPLPYHIEVRDYLKASEPDLWRWFASARAQADYTEQLRLDLLKSTYRLDPVAHPDLHRSLDEAKARLQLDIPVTLYQAQNSPQPNAALLFIPGEGHIVLSGPILSLLNREEVQSVLAHELAHYRLWQWESGDLNIADRLLQAVAVDPRSLASHQETARRFQLYTEIFADRGSLRVTRSLETVVAGLVKLQTGLPDVSASAYLRQADEIFSAQNVSTKGLSHPEAFIRARALALWRDAPASAVARISAMIEGAVSWNTLDIPAQARLTANTRTFLEQLLQPAWFQTPAVLGHARLFFPDFQPAPAAKAPADASATFSFNDPALREYVAYLLLDFASADPQLEDLPLAAALNWSLALGLDSQFEKLAAKELGRRLRDIRKLRDQADAMLAKAAEQPDNRAGRSGRPT